MKVKITSAASPATEPLERSALFHRSPAIAAKTTADPLRRDYQRSATDLGRAFVTELEGFGRSPALILTHNDADGLAAGVILAKALERAGLRTRIRIVGRGESAWSENMRAELAEEDIGGLIVADLGVRGETIRHDLPTMIIDHHVPQGCPRHGTVISGFGMAPIPTASLLAYRCAARVGPIDDLLWLAALGIIGDMEEASGFPEMQEAREAYGITVLRKAASLLNQGRRSSTGNAYPALSLLQKASGPKDVLSGMYPETKQLKMAAEEVRAETARVRKIAPRVVGQVALIRFSSRCQVHPLVAHTWTGRIKDRIVLAANTGFRPGWVHFSARSANDVDLVGFLREHAPSGADESYGSGHRNATGGALRLHDWNEFVRNLGFGPETGMPV